MTPTDIATRIDEWEKEAKDLLSDMYLPGDVPAVSDPMKKVLTLCAALREQLTIKERLRLIAKHGVMRSNCPCCGEIVAHIYQTKDALKPTLEGLGE